MGFWLCVMLNVSCYYYGNGFGFDYNVVYVNYFYFGMWGYGVCC